MRPIAQLADTLHRMDGRSYAGYRQIKGLWGADGFTLAIDHVAGDPFATPSRVRVVIPAAQHEIPEHWRSEPTRRVALTDLLLRRFAEAAGQTDRSGSGHSGELLIDDGGAEVLPRSGCGFVGDALELRFRVGLPARGRRILGREAARLLTEAVPAAAARVHWAALDPERVAAFIRLVEDHAHVQAQLAERGLVAFVRDGSILPRASGVSNKPMPDAVPFQSPPSLAVELSTMHHGTVVGMGLPVGVTVITGGGFHGKTTLLEAIAAGIDPHIPGDGREWVVTSRDVVKLRSEDGRAVTGVDLSPFISGLPRGLPTDRFTTPDASGSTSLAAAIIEALELGASTIVLDEDTSATNLLIRDARMQALVARETITPLIDRVQGLHRDRGISTVLVVGGSGDYLEVADQVILMEDYHPRDVTADAKTIAAAHPTGRAADPAAPLGDIAPRRPDLASLDPRRGSKSRVRAHGRRELSFGTDLIDLSALEQLVDDSQARAIGALLQWIAAHGTDGQTVVELADVALARAGAPNMYAVAGLPELAGVRRYELAGAVNRLRSLELL